MRSFRRVCCILAMPPALAAVNTSASALEHSKWLSVCVQSLGLRSAPARNNTSGAGYGMDNGVWGHLCGQQQPADWNTILKNAIGFIEGFADSDNRYLLIVRRCPGLSNSYDKAGTFPKCNEVSDGIVSALPVTMRHHDENALVAWVVKEIPEFRPPPQPPARP